MADDRFDVVTEAPPGFAGPFQRVRPKYHAMMEPVFPCREMPTRHCPAVFDDVCPPLAACARFESDDARPWLPELRPHAAGTP